jgi:SpoVK/Ycf46/Vps4 family AAA+-type ATPase
MTKNIPSFTYENNKNKKIIIKPLNHNHIENNLKFPFPNNDIIKIIPIHSNNCQNMKTNNQSSIIPPNISKIFEMLIKNETIDKEELEDVNKFTINKNTKYDEIDTQINTLDTLIKITNELDIKKKYTFDLNKLKNLFTPLNKLKEFIGMTNIKDNIIKQIIFFLQNLDEDRDLMHTIITGPPGVGKTKLAYVLGEMYFKLGVFKCKKGTEFTSPITGEKIDFKFTLARRSDLIGEYVGHTAMKTQKVIDDAIGGVLFIDEAYSLGNSDKKDTFSKECIDTLNQNLTEQKGKLAVIIAGYENELEKCFFSYNEGLRRRFPFRYEINSYTFEELGKIFIAKIKESKWDIDQNLYLEKQENKLYKFFKINYKEFPNFGGDMELLLFSTKIAHSLRIFGKNPEYRKFINIDDLNKGFEIFKDSKKKKEEQPLLNMYI